ncbi:MAG TPA: AAA family ATPase [Thermoanaerobaculia bacterium]|nr:AAA family ATPase [Thermoanaerobaculia bacterium]
MAGVGYRLVILFLNGAFGIGKTTVARALVARLPRAVLFDPEPLGIVLQRLRRVDDFQDLALWRRLTILALRLTRLLRTNVVVPMAISNAAYLAELRDGVSRFEPRVRHVCLVAPFEVVRERLRRRGADAGEWELRRARECCDVHGEARFAVQVDAQREPSAIVEEVLNRI